ncbi:uncharacterized protein CDAR_27811 [Caerostris darwini]|uniref:Uncharacterized protein n=1 Tax=Caerostris darwini TaxID=1538125 RepID=A0AAV4SRE3_9ARAC|nr:uncharacterized protein CDAR_27811 [Caerostris darwini]
MALFKVGGLLLLFLISSSKADIKGEEPSDKITANDVPDIEAQPSTNVEAKLDSKPLPKASKVSEFYIGDLLRTSDKDQLDTSSTIHNPISSTPEYNQRASSSEEAALFSNSGFQGGQYYVGDQVLLPLMHPGGVQNPINAAGESPLNVYEKVSVPQAGVVGRNAMPKQGNSPASRRYEPAPLHHEGGDCKKHRHAVSASNDQGYATDESAPYNHGRVPPGPPEYRNPDSYRQEDSYEDSPAYSRSYPSSSKSYAAEHDSNTNSESSSGKSYTTSKSSSSSKTVEPKNKRGKVVVFDNRKLPQQGYSRGRGQGSRKKSKARPSHSPDSYSEQEPPYQGSPERDQYYDGPHSQAPSRYHSNTEAPVNRKPEQHYSEQPEPEYERGNYRKSKAPPAASYPDDGYSQPPQRERQHSGPPQKYSPNEGPRGQPSGYYNEESYAPEPPAPHRGENRYHKAPNYNSPRPHDERQQYQESAPMAPARPTNERQYDGYTPQSGPRDVSYKRNSQAPRSSRGKRPEYAYESAPYSHGQSSEGHPRTQRSSSRLARSSPQRYRPSTGEGRSPSPVPAVELQELARKETGPQQLQLQPSVSYSESSYNMGDGAPSKTAVPAKSPKPEARIYEAPQKMINPLLSRELGMQGRDPGYEAPYKPFNSEYPARFGNDNFNINPLSAEQPYAEGPESGERGYEPEPFEKPQQPYEDHEGDVGDDDSSPPKGKVIGYADHYGNHEPLELDEEFFQKYGISNKAKIIVASHVNPNLFVADGTQVAEGGSSSDEEEPFDQREQFEERSQEPKKEVEEDSYKPRRPQLFEAPQEAPQSFSQLVDSDPKFLRNLDKPTKPKRPEIGQFEEYDPSMDELIFRSSVGDPKEFVKSKGSREMVQKHGNGVSRIIFTQHSASENKEEYLPKKDGEGLEAESKNYAYPFKEYVAKINIKIILIENHYATFHTLDGQHISQLAFYPQSATHATFTTNTDKYPSSCKVLQSFIFFRLTHIANPLNSRSNEADIFFRHTFIAPPIHLGVRWCLLASSSHA